ncbi:MAG TPA: hypothetical protein VGM37_01445 [Armatimonadota bacterium]
MSADAHVDIERTLGRLEANQEGTAKAVERIEEAMGGINRSLATLADQGRTLVDHDGRIANLEDAEKTRHDRETEARGWIKATQFAYRYGLSPMLVLAVEHAESLWSTLRRAIHWN